MQLKSICSAALLAITAFSSGQTIKYTDYLGQIKVAGPILPLAADEDGRLFFGTFDGTASKLYMIEQPETEMGNAAAAGVLIAEFPEFDPGRGLQSLQVTSAGDLLVAGDTGKADQPNIWKYNQLAGGASATFAKDESFSAAAAAKSARRSGVSIFSDTPSSKILIANGLNNMDFFGFDGQPISGPFRVCNNYMREGLYNSTDNVFYPLRNGSGIGEMLRNYVSSVNTTDGGNLTTTTLIPDGAPATNLGSARQNGYYFAAQNQLITLDVEPTGVAQTTAPTVRIWDIKDSGTSLSLAYRIDGTSETEKFASIGDAVVSKNRLYISSSGLKTIYVFGPATASVKPWSRYEDATAIRNTSAIEASRR